MEAKSARDIAIRTGLRLTYVYARARKLRKKGVQLPFHLYTRPNRGERPINVDKLNRLVEKMTDAADKVE